MTVPAGRRTTRITRRKMLGTLAALGGIGLAGSMTGVASVARAQGHLANLGL